VAVATSSQRRKRQRGSIEDLPSGALRVKVYAGIDPVSKHRRYLTETIPAGHDAGKSAEKARTRLLNQVDEKRNPRTAASLNQLLDRWLGVLDVEASTRRGYVTKLDKHIRPVLGAIPASRIDAETLETFYADLRTCRDHCLRREYSSLSEPHVCTPLSDSSIRAIHWILSGAFRRALRWGWLAVNPTEHAQPPPLPKPDPRPPTADEAARILEEAARDPGWGAYVWTAMTTGARRSEMCALHWPSRTSRREGTISTIDLDRSVVTIRRAIFNNDDGILKEKDTKTHQQRRVVLDAQTVEVLREHLTRSQEQARALGIELVDGGYVFSALPNGSAPLTPDTVTQRYNRMTRRLGIDTTLKNLRHYSATELLMAGVDIRTIAGRLGHGSGGATTLRVYAAWTGEADQRAATTLSARMPARRQLSATPTATSSTRRPDAGGRESASPYRQIAKDLQGAITSGVLRPGDHLPTVKELAARYGVAVGTAHRAIALLNTDGLVRVSRGSRAIIV